MRYVLHELRAALCFVPRDVDPTRGWGLGVGGDVAAVIVSFEGDEDQGLAQPSGPRRHAPRLGLTGASRL